MECLAQLYPFPYGLSHFANGAAIPSHYNPESKGAYVEELSKSPLQRQQKDNANSSTETVFVGYITQDSNKDARQHVPSGVKLPPLQYYEKMHASSYILSPDGDRPECYRHYEAIGLGTMPITQLHPHLYRHLEGSVVFNTTDWNVTKLETALDKTPAVNRRLVFEEYWMHYVERQVGRPMLWWDETKQERRLLSEILKDLQTSSSSSIVKT